MKKKRHVMVGQKWFDRQGEFRILAVADGWAMCKRDGESRPWLRSFEVVNAEGAMRDDVLDDDRKLSAREFSVMHQIATGKSVNDIAHSLGLSPSTISTYRTRLLRKLDVDSNVGIAMFAVNGERA